MPRSSANSTRRTRGKRKRRFRLSKYLPSAQQRRRWFRTYRRLPAMMQVGVACAVVVLVWFVLNGAYQVIRKPSELFFPVSGVLYKTPAETWDDYGTIFRRHSTHIMTPELLAAIAQVEGSGNPIVRTYWKWSLTHEPFEMYRPASSAVGMYQITDGTFDEARRYCIHDHRVVEDGPWNDPKSCWFNDLYARVVPSHAVELTSAYLHQKIVTILQRHRIVNASPKQKQELAAVVHLCGAGAGSSFARRGFRLTSGQRCGDHEVRRYIAKIDTMARVFARLRAQD
jgi:hypothetical protein